MNPDNNKPQQPAANPLDRYTVVPQQNGGQQDEGPWYKPQAPSITLPKGGGALRGIDEKFTVNAVNGTAALQVPLPLTPGRNGFTPALSLSYNSGSGNSEFGLGWNLSLPAIQRKTDKRLPQYNDAAESDIFLLAGAEDLVPVMNYDRSTGQWSEDAFTRDGIYHVRRYRPRIEGLHARIEYITKTGSSKGWWRVTTKDNITTYYGLTEEGRISDPADSTRIFKWLPQLVFDHKGNVQEFTYKTEDFENVGTASLPASHERNRLNGQSPCTNKYLKSVSYCNAQPQLIAEDSAEHVYEPTLGTPDFLMQLVFDYGDHNDASGDPTPAGNATWPCRKDPFSDFHAGFEIRTYRKCSRVLMFHIFDELKGGAPCLVRSLDLTWRYDDSLIATPYLEANYITQITQTGWKWKDGSPGSYHTSALPPMVLEYEEVSWNTELKAIDRSNAANAPQGLTGNYQWIDLWGEGLPGILTEQGGGWFYKRNMGQGSFTPAQSIAPKPSFTGLGTSLQWQDLDADGRRQLVSSDPAAGGYFELNDDQQWETFRRFKSQINVDWNSPWTKTLDVDGDGKPDVLITGDHVWTWYRNEGTEGYSEGGRVPVSGHEDNPSPVGGGWEGAPRLLLNDTIQSIFLADMNGDGLTDIVRIKNGEICYWPNKGYGRFGAKVTMTDAPLFDNPDNYNPQYLTLADISGTGAADIIYLGNNRCTAWLNLSGNAWSERKEINPLPSAEPYSKIAVMDFLGNGTGCIVWSSPLPQHAHAPMQYIDLMGGKKPYLLKRYGNGFGKHTELCYKSSAWFYLRDREAGKPWATRLPFPVHCISRTITTDDVSETSYTQCYRYHHGYYDHEEREFRGFGMVEVKDIESAATDGDPDHDLDQPPVLTKTWYHTGAWLRERTLTDGFRDEYYTHPSWQEPAQQVTLLEPGTPAGSSSAPGEDWRRAAYRSLKGSPLRQEVYALDSTPDEDKPYTVTTYTYCIKTLQHGLTAQGRPAPLAGGWSGFSYQEQSLAFQCERTPADPRILHDITLVVDDLGDIIEAAKISYPRKTIPAGLPQEVQDRQAEMLFTYTRNAYSLPLYSNNPYKRDNQYRPRLLSEAKTYQLHLHPDDYPADLWTTDRLKVLAPGVKPWVLGSGLLIYDNVNNLYTQAVTLDYSDTPAPAPGQPQLRLIAHARTLYYDDSFTQPLLQGEHSYTGIPYEQYTLAFTGSLLNNLYGSGNWTDAMLESGGYADPGEDGNWWLPSGTVQYTDATFTDPAQQFFTPLSFTDPWGNTTKISYWESVSKAYWLLPAATEDALENVTTVLAYDWRCLQPASIMDINDNITDMLYDALCMPVAMALKGKGAQGDNLDTIDPGDSQDLAWQEDFWNDTSRAADLIQGATWRCVYDLAPAAGQPAAVAMIAREEHAAVNMNSRTLIRISYSDGLGRIAMHKAQCEPRVIGADTMFWIGSGKTVYNNKGNIVLQYEPYFDTTHDYDKAAQLVAAGDSVSARMFYDPLGRVYRTEMPDGSFSRTEWTAWEQTVYDPNDTVPDSAWYTLRDSGALSGDPDEADAKTKAAAHADTPVTTHLDTLARPFYTRQYLTGITTASVAGTDYYDSFVTLDILGNRLAVHQEVGIAPSAAWQTPLTYKYNLLKAVCLQESTDSGTQKMISDIAQQPAYAWDADDRLFIDHYDALRRPASKELIYAGSVILEQLIYIDGPGGDASANLRGRLYIKQDGAGTYKIIAYDFKGNPLTVDTQFVEDFTLADVDWSASVAQTGEYFTTETVYDALNRPVSITDPGDNSTEYVYDTGGLLKEVYLTPSGGAQTAYVTDIVYDAKGQRQYVSYGNSTTTTYTYDPYTFRLKRLLTQKGPDTFQDLEYFYDPAGNITRLWDHSQRSLFFNNSIVLPVQDYTYDALYRLSEAHGREQTGTATFGTVDNYNDNPWMGIAHKGDDNSTQNYAQYYTYDAAGNILSLQHQANAGSYTRDYTYITGTNRLEETTVGSSTYTYGHDTRGNMTVMPHLSAMVWNARNQLCQTSNGTVTGYYQYRDGQRMRKVVLKPGGIKEERLYLGNYEVYRKYTGATLDLERITVHIADDTGRIALFEKRTVGSDPAPATLHRYIYSNHLGSAALELDHNAAIISYEEYHPYGTTAYQAMNAAINAVAKRYRYTGKERDEESGLYYHGARYYAPWLGRWTAGDPLESKYAPQSPYVYCSGNPVSRIDPDGMGDKDKTQPNTVSQHNIQNTTGFWETHNADGTFTGERAADIPLQEFTLSAKGSSSSGSNKWMDISGLKASRFGYSDDGFSDPMNYFSFFDNMGVAAYNGVVDIGNMIVNAEGTLKDVGNYFSEVGTYVYNTPLSKQLTDLKADFANTFTNVQTYENIGGTLLTGKLVGMSSVQTPTLNITSKPFLKENVAKTFRFEDYSKVTLTEPKIFARYYDNDLAFAKGRFMSEPSAITGIKFLDRMGLALKPSWNKMTKIAYWEIPVGTTVYEGKAAMQFPWIGGKTQYFLPDISNAKRVIKP